MPWLPSLAQPSGWSAPGIGLGCGSPGVPRGSGVPDGASGGPGRGPESRWVRRRSRRHRRRRRPGTLMATTHAAPMQAATASNTVPARRAPGCPTVRPMRPVTHPSAANVIAIAHPRMMRSFHESDILSSLLLSAWRYEWSGARRGRTPAWARVPGRRSWGASRRPSGTVDRGSRRPQDRRGCAVAARSG